MPNTFYTDPLTRLFEGDARQVLKELPAASVDMAMTSPPYWTLRSYDTEPLIWDGEPDCAHEWGKKVVKSSAHRAGESNPSKEGYTKNAGAWTNSRGQFCLKCGAWRGQLGSEPTPDLFIEHLCDIFDQVRRVLRSTGTLWVNLDDSSWNAKGTCYNPGGGAAGTTLPSILNKKGAGVYPLDRGNRSDNPDIPLKSLVGIPERFVLEMMRRGWVHRRTIIWHKPNVMPESTMDAFTIDFEYLYFFSASDRMRFWVNEKTRAIVGKKPLGPKGQEGVDWDWITCSTCKGTGIRAGTPHKRCSGTGKVKRTYWHGKTYFFDQQFEPIAESTIGRGPVDFGGAKGRAYKPERNYDYSKCSTLGRHMRSVWTIPTKGYKGAHFAVYPEELCRTPILASCPAAVCPKCGLPQVKIYQDTGKLVSSNNIYSEKGTIKTALHIGCSPTSSLLTKTWKEKVEVGYSDCGCHAGYRPGVVLDPFAGTGATQAEAKRLGRQSIGIETSSKYCKLNAKRLEGAHSPLLA